jgi:TonB family protein
MDPRSCIHLFVHRRYLAPLLRADDRENLESSLRKDLQQQLLSLQHPDFGTRLQFDSLGNLVGQPNPGPWSTSGLLQVTKVRVSRDRLQLDGKRALLILRPNGTSADTARSHAVQNKVLVTDENVRVIVAIPDLDGLKVNNILATIFLGGALAQRISEYWKPNETAVKELGDGLTNVILGQLEGNRPVYRAHPGLVEIPIPKYTPDPVYNEHAKRDKIQGTASLSIVVNEKGFPEVLEVTRGLAEGLDTQALVAVAKWRFKPATKNDQPVAVLIHVEVTFGLY